MVVRPIPRSRAASAVTIAATILANTPPPAHASVRINEVVSLNQNGLRDENGDRPDWIELWNPGPAPVDLAGWSLSDDPGRPRRWTFSTGSIPPNGHLVVFASDKNRQPTPGTPLPPEAIPGLAVWLQADRIDPANPAHVRQSASGNSVRLWPDASGHARHARQESPALQPRLVLHPRPHLAFDGVDDLLRLTAVPATNDFTIVAVFEPTRSHEVEAPGSSGVGGTQGQAWLFGAAHGGDSGAGLGVSVGTNGVSVYEHGSGYMPAVATLESALGGGFQLLLAACAQRVPLLSVNGIPAHPGNLSPRNPVTAPTEIGAGSYGAFAGSLREVIVYHRTLSPAEQAGLEAHLVARHHLTPPLVLHTNFRISADGERLLLTRPDGTRADDVRVPALPRDVAWGRLPQNPDAFRFFETPTPGAPNPNQGGTAFLQAPRFDRAPGFHAEPISLNLSSPDPAVRIHYTLDGSMPGPDSPRFTDALRITNRSTLPNRISSIPTAPGWSPPAGPVFKGTVVRARAFRDDAIPSEPVTATYFIHPRGRGRFSLPVVSLATDDRHFFNADTGIYVPGNAPGGNYAQSGDAWERPVHVEFFETDGSRPIAQESGVRMHGNTSFGFPIKALRLHPLNQRGTGPFRHRIFPDFPVDTFHRLLLRPSGHDHHLTLMRDGLMQGLMRETGIDTQHYRPAVLFLNGEYWGIHNLQEAFEKHYFTAHHPEVDPEAVDYLEGYAPGAFAYEGDPSVYHNLVRTLQERPIQSPDTLAAVHAAMDVANFHDYKIAEIFYYRWDIGNHRLWRPRTPDGRLRWILFDCDVGFGGFWSQPEPWSFDMLSAVLEPSGSLHGHNNPTTILLLQKLLAHPDLRNAFVNRTADLLNTTLSTPRMLEHIDRMAAEIAPEIPDHTLRWRAPANLTEWRRNVDALRTFARERPHHLRRHFMNRFGLSGTADLTVLNPPSETGSLRVNSLNPIPAGPGAWTGTYFQGLPVTIEATPARGFRFSGWRELPGLTTNPLSMTLRGAFTLTPEFEPDGPVTWGQPVLEAGGNLFLPVQGPPHTGFRVESSPDLRAWSVAGSVTTDASGSARFRVAVSEAGRFFRLAGITAANPR